MFRIEEIKNFIYKYTNKDFEILYSSLINENIYPQSRIKKNKAKASELIYVRFLKHFLQDGIDLDYKWLAEIAAKIEYGSEILQYHLQYIKPTSDNKFFTITDAIKYISCELKPEIIITNKKREKFRKVVVHISDLHFGEKHLYNDEKYLIMPIDERPSLESELFQDLEMQNMINGEVDFVVVSGDLTWDADPQDFDKAKKFLHSLSKKIKVPLNNFVIVPGNHDICWKQDRPKEYQPKNDFDLHYNNFYELFYKKKPNEYCSINSLDDHIAIVGFNSARIEPNSHGIGYVGLKQCEKEIKNLKRKNIFTENHIKIAVMHHHLVPVSLIEYIPTEFHEHISLTIDSESIIDNLIKQNFSIVLHGHQHQPFYAVERRLTIDTTASKRDLIICGAGSISINSSHNNTFGRNQYQLLTITESSVNIESRYTSGRGCGFERHRLLSEWLH